MQQVQFQDGTQQPIHLIIIHAFVILLTYATMIPNATPYLDYWFPPKSSLPRAFLIDSNEPVVIFPDWLIMKMIRSAVDCLVDAAVKDLTPQQTVLFIQSFGTPVNSMSKLLARLDFAVIEQTAVVKEAIGNGTYFGQVIEIQQARGAKNGHIAIQTLQLNNNVLAEPPKREIVVTRQFEMPKIEKEVLWKFDFEKVVSTLCGKNPQHTNSQSVRNWTQHLLTTTNDQEIVYLAKMLDEKHGELKNLTNSDSYTLARALYVLFKRPKYRDMAVKFNWKFLPWLGKTSILKINGFANFFF